VEICARLTDSLNVCGEGLALPPMLQAIDRLGRHAVILGLGRFAQFLIKYFGDKICKLLILQKTVAAKFLNRELLEVMRIHFYLLDMMALRLL